MISDPIKQLISSFTTNPLHSDWSNYDGPRFVTNKITIRVGSFYERLRYAVDYQEEHVLRRAAIERIVRRLLLFSNLKEIGREVLEEMVRASYIDNDAVPESLAADIQNIIIKYKRLESMIGGECDILWSYAAIEIEQHLFPAELSERTFTAIFQTVVKYLKPKEPDLIKEDDFNLQVYIACRRTFLLESHAALSYSLFRIMVGEWRENLTPDDEVLGSVASRFHKLQAEIDELMNNPTQWKIAGRLHNESIYFSILNNLCHRHGADAITVLNDEEKLSDAISRMLSRIYEAHQSKISQSATRAIIYVLITKIIIGLAIELPYEIFILGDINYTALAINILFAPALLMALTKTIKYPGDENTNEVIHNFKQFISGENPTMQYVTVRPKSSMQRLGHFLFAAAFFAATFGIIITALRYLEFNPASTALFLVFVCIVTFMGLRIRTKAKEWSVEHEDESLGGLLWFLFVLPVVRTGRWISERLSSINIFVFFMDFILETPFKIILGSFDSFVSYVKESRREGM